MGLGVQTMMYTPRGCMTTWVFTCGIFLVVYIKSQKQNDPWPEKKILTHMEREIKNLDQTITSYPPLDILWCVPKTNIFNTVIVDAVTLFVCYFVD